MIVERSSPRLRFSSINVVRAIIAELLQMMCGLGDNPFRRYAPLPLLYPSQIGVGIRRGHPRSSQIGVHFSKKSWIGVDLSLHLPNYPFTQLPIFHGPQPDLSAETP